jgi:hypothetical protein
MVNKNINKVNLYEKDCAPTRCNRAVAGAMIKQYQELAIIL